MSYDNDDDDDDNAITSCHCDVAAETQSCIHRSHHRLNHKFHQ